MRSSAAVAVHSTAKEKLGKDIQIQPRIVLETSYIGAIWNKYPKAKTVQHIMASSRNYPTKEVEHLLILFSVFYRTTDLVTGRRKQRKQENTVQCCIVNLCQKRVSEIVIFLKETGLDRQLHVNGNK